MIEQQIDPNIQKMIDDIRQDISLVKTIVTDVKAGGVTGAIKDAPAIIQAVEQQIPDVKAVIPVVKAGYQTSEFWIIVVLLLANLVFETVKGTGLPIDVNATIGALTAIYTVCRQIIKGNATTASVATSTVVAATK